MGFKEVLGYDPVEYTDFPFSHICDIPSFSSN